MAQVAPTSIPFPQAPTWRASARDAAWTAVWRLSSPALRILGQVLAADYARDADREAALRARRH